MITRWMIGLLLLLAPSAAVAGDGTGPVHVSSGTVVDLGIVKSRYADPRRVVVWLPPHYSERGPKHAVLYMHDGQNLFDDQTAGYGHEWQIDEHLSKLMADKRVRPTIVVGIWNTPKRLQEYVPSKAFASLPADYRGKVKALYGGDPLSDGYLKFIVQELRPIIDRKFDVKTDRADTFIMGSSMGGLISLYAIDEYPQIFGGAGMVSTHWPLVINPDGKPLSDEDYEVVSATFERYLAPALPNPRNHRLYFDYGSETLDAAYARYQARVDKVVARRGYTQGKNWLTKSFPGQKHNEVSWASRVDIPLTLLLAR